MTSATVPMLSPDGTPGDIPQERVQDAVKAGFKQAVLMTSPDGKNGYIPADKQQDAISAGFKPTVAPQKSLLQKAKDAFDALTTVTPEQQAGHGAVVNAAQRFGAGAIKAVGSPIVHPLDTLQGIGHTIAHPLDEAHSEVDQLYKDPATFAGQAAGGALLGEAMAPVVSPVADALKSGLGRAVLLGKTPEGAYESALKPSTTLSQADRAAMVQTGLANKIPVSKGGLEAIGSKIDDLNQAIKDEIAADPTRPIDPQAVATRADIAKAKFAKQVNAGGDLAAIDASKQQFLEEQGALPQTASSAAKPAPPMNAEDAQAMKQGTYRVLSGKFGEQGSASVEAQKALARGLKEEIATQFPEIDNLNTQESRLLDLQPILERAVNRISNHQLIGIGTPIAGAAAKAVTGSGSVGIVASVLKSVLDDPYVKSRLAISLSKGANIPFSQASARVGAYSAALGSTSPAAEETVADQTSK